MNRLEWRKYVLPTLPELMEQHKKELIRDKKRDMKR
jgi:hypothetical protein